jgi:hypothetical protein
MLNSEHLLYRNILPVFDAVSLTHLLPLASALHPGVVGEVVDELLAAPTLILRLERLLQEGRGNDAGFQVFALGECVRV